MSVDEVAPPRVALALVELVGCVCEQLTVNGAGPTCWCGLTAGAAPSWDYCGAECASDACGMGWVRLASVFPTSVFPLPITDDRCALPLAWQIEVGALRCMPMMPDGSPLDSTTMTEVALDQLLDARALHLALKCCTAGTVAAEAYVPVGPDGGCVGGFWTAYLSVG